VTPDEILEAARSLMERPEAATAGVWPRASAILTRQALEEALDGVWASDVATDAVADCSMRTQLLCARSYTDPILAEQVAWVWAELSRGCHYDPYELAPTATELEDWMTTIAGLIAELGKRGPNV
jgi:hypothetical protein